MLSCIAEDGLVKLDGESSTVLVLKSAKVCHTQGADNNTLLIANYQLVKPSHSNAQTLTEMGGTAVSWWLEISQCAKDSDLEDKWLKRLELHSKPLTLNQPVDSPVASGINTTMLLSLKPPSPEVSATWDGKPLTKWMTDPKLSRTESSSFYSLEVRKVKRFDWS